jgi:hypothetical protein
VVSTIKGCLCCRKCGFNGPVILVTLRRCFSESIRITFLLIVSERHSFSTFGRLLTTLQSQETEGLKEKGESQSQIQKMVRKYRIMHTEVDASRFKWLWKYEILEFQECLLFWVHLVWYYSCPCCGNDTQKLLSKALACTVPQSNS